MNTAQHFVFQIPLSRCKLNFLLYDAFGNILEAMSQVMKILREFIAYSDFYIWRKVTATTRIHNGNTNLEN